MASLLKPAPGTQQNQDLAAIAEEKFRSAGYKNAPVGMLAYARHKKETQPFDYAIILKSYKNAQNLPTYAAGTQDVWVEIPAGFSVNLTKENARRKFLEQLHGVMFEEIADIKGELTEDIFIALLDKHTDMFAYHVTRDRGFTVTFDTPITLKGPLNKPEEQLKFLHYTLGWAEADIQRIIPQLRQAKGGSREIDIAYLSALIGHYGEDSVAVEPFDMAAFREGREEAGIDVDLDIATNLKDQFFQLSIHSKRSLDAGAPARDERLLLACFEETFRLLDVHEELEDDAQDGGAREEPAQLTLIKWRKLVLKAIRNHGVTHETIAAANRFNAVLLIAQYIQDPAAQTLTAIDAPDPFFSPQESKALLAAIDDEKLVVNAKVQRFPLSPPL